MQIKHPSLKDYNLNLEGLVGPENGVFCRGRIINQNEIKLPKYWEDLVEETSISVHLTPVGAHQHIIVKRIRYICSLMGECLLILTILLWEKGRTYPI